MEMEAPFDGLLLLISFAKRPGSLTEQAPMRGPGVDLPDLKILNYFFLISCVEKHDWDVVTQTSGSQEFW